MKKDDHHAPVFGGAVSTAQEEKNEGRQLGQRLGCVRDQTVYKNHADDGVTANAALSAIAWTAYGRGPVCEQSARIANRGGCTSCRQRWTAKKLPARA